MGNNLQKGLLVGFLIGFIIGLLICIFMFAYNLFGALENNGYKYNCDYWNNTYCQIQKIENKPFIAGGSLCIGYTNGIRNCYWNYNNTWYYNNGIKIGTLKD